jgi:thymidylate synthase (FAD)
MTESGFDSIPVLDHGYIKLIESYGSDERIIEAARMSTNKGFQGWGPFKCDMCAGFGQVDENNRPVNGFDLICPRCKGQSTVPGDEKLLSYLYSHKHATPFEMAGLIIEVQAPIFVFREWHRHRTQSYNEMSARYTPLPDINYMLYAYY